jgi:glutaredoxin
MITAEGCIDCRRAKALIAQAAVLAQEEFEIVELDYNSEEAIEKALLYSMNAVPSFVIRGKVFNVANPPLNDLIQALKTKAV